MGNEKEESTLHNITNMFVIQIESARQGQYKGAGIGVNEYVYWEAFTSPSYPVCTQVTQAQRLNYSITVGIL